MNFFTHIIIQHAADFFDCRFLFFFFHFFQCGIIDHVRNWHIARFCFHEIVDENHLQCFSDIDFLIEVRLKKNSHQRHPPCMLGNAFLSAG